MGSGRKKKRWVAIALLLAMPGGAVCAHAQASPAFEDLVDDFDRFAGETSALPDAARAALFRARFAGRAGGFYDLRGRDPVRYDERTAKALKAWPTQREAVMRVASAFAAAFTRGTAKFRHAFPDFRSRAPTFLIHSMGEMDGGTRDFGHGQLLYFGADVIARIHDDRTIGPLFDHELFHVHHAKAFPECEAVWCGLWTEGLAVYVTGRLNPGAGDTALLLTSPEPIRPAVEPRIKEAMCSLSGKLDSKRPEDMASLFQGQSVAGSPFPPRYGYYLGYVLAGRMARGSSPELLARMTPAEVRPLLERAIAGYGPCPSKTATPG